MELYINENDIKTLIKEYKDVNPSFVFSTYTKVVNKNEYLCDFYISGKPCKVRFYVKSKKNTVRMVPVGNNIEEANLLISYLEKKGFSIDGVNPEQTVFMCDKNAIDELIISIENEFAAEIKVENHQHGRIRFVGSNMDYVDITYYPSRNKAMIQGRPFKTFNIIMALLSQISTISFDSVVQINNAFVNNNLSTSIIRKKIKTYLINSYSYLDEALIKSLSGSIISLSVVRNSDDYTGCVTGAFKTLEGYLSKVLVQKYHYTLTPPSKFSMFHKNNSNGLFELKDDRTSSTLEAKQLLSLYSIYSNKRNVFLHATIDPSQTRIIETRQEAYDIVVEILKKIEESYNIFYK